MNHPDELKYTKEHTWVKVEGNLATIGITDYAQSELGEIVFVELPEIESEVEHLTEFGVVESVKTVSDLYSPVSGVIIETNEELLDSPEIVNDSPYDDGWMIKVEMNDPKELASLMSAEEYQDFVETLQH
ncbi:MAG: glycine cleavage system protein GcvH [bacterium]